MITREIKIRLRSGQSLHHEPPWKQQIIKTQKIQRKFKIFTLEIIMFYINWLTCHKILSIGNKPNHISYYLIASNLYFRFRYSASAFKYKSLFLNLPRPTNNAWISSKFSLHLRLVDFAWCDLRLIHISGYICLREYFIPSDRIVSSTYWKIQNIRKGQIGKDIYK